MVTEAIESFDGTPGAAESRCPAGELGVAVSVWYGKAVVEPKEPGRKPQAVPEALAAQIRRWPSAIRGGATSASRVVARRAGDSWLVSLTRSVVTGCSERPRGCFGDSCSCAKTSFPTTLKTLS